MERWYNLTMNKGMKMIDIYRIRYEGRGDNENMFGVMTHFSESYDEAVVMTRRWLDQVYGKDSVFDLFDDGTTFQYGG